MHDDNLKFAGGVASQELGLVCLEISESQLQCIDLSNGKVVSTIPGKNNRPLTWFHGKLIGWKPDFHGRNVVKPFVADVSSPVATIVTLPELTLPNWVDSQSANADRFFLAASENDLQVTFRWHAQVKFEGGAPPPMEVLDEIEQSSQGIAVYDIESKQLLSSSLSVHASDDFPEARGTAVLDPPGGSYRIPYCQGMKIKSDPWTARGRIMALWPNVDGSSRSLNLVSSELDSGQILGLTSQQLAPRGIDPAKDEIHVSGDGHHIFVGVTDVGSEANLSWQVFEAGGNCLGTIPREPGTLDIAKVGNQILYIVDKVEEIKTGKRRQRFLSSLDFPSGRLHWTLPVFDRIDQPPLQRPPGNC